MIKLYKFIRSIFCKHEYPIENIKLTNIKPLEKPKGKSVEEWSEYYSNIYIHPSHTKRVSCICDKCGKKAFAHCGIDLKGKLIRKIK